MTPFFHHWIATYGVPAIFVLLLLGVFGLPVPDETLLTVAGVMIRQGRLPMAATVIAAVLGAIGGVSLSYIVGRRFGLEVVARYGRRLHVRPADLDRVHQWFEHAGRWLLMFGYFIPGVRHLTAIVAGSSQLPVGAFARFAYGGAAIWAVTFLGLGWYAGPEGEAALARIHGHRVMVLTVVGVLIVGAALLHRAGRLRKGPRRG